MLTQFRCECDLTALALDSIKVTPEAATIVPRSSITVNFKGQMRPWVNKHNSHNGMQISTFNLSTKFLMCRIQI